MPIRKLPLLLINQIAAGEVIERPASVVKELVENSLDAGATRIDVAIEDGGRQLIRVADNGRGIPPDELPLAVAPHATSKLDRPEQLEAIATLGFRGEALASMASISRLRITTRPTDDQGQLSEEAFVLEASGDQVSPVAPAAGAPGTVIEVRDLFFNTPARRKFLRSPSTEFGHINDTLSRIAMVWPQVGFRLTHNGRKVLDAPPGQDQRSRCLEVVGKDLDEAMLVAEHQDPPQRGGGQVWAVVGLPEIARATSKAQYLCVNGRPVRDRGLSHAVKEAYRGLIPPDRHPVAVVFLHIDPREVDVNVHPAKSEVRFNEPNRVHGLVLAALRQRLLGADLTPSVSFNQPTKPSFDFGKADGQGENASADPGAFVEYFKKMDPTQKGFVYQEVQRAMGGDSGAAVAPPPPAAPVAEAQGDVGLAPQPGLPPVLRAQGVLQVHNSYLVTQDENGILIVDQHALHERVMFEQLSRRVLGEGKPLESQRLLMPATFDVSARMMGSLEALSPLLARIGVEAEPMGPTTVAVHAFPSFLFERRVEPEPFLKELIEKVDDGQIDVGSTNRDEAALHEVLDMMSCKAAVKAGDHLTAEELASLLEQRETVERSSNCPHGRPTAIRLTLRDLEKQFKRA